MFFCRRELDNSEADRAQHIKKIHDLQEHIQEKDQQLIEMQEQVLAFLQVSGVICFIRYMIDLF